MPEQGLPRAATVQGGRGMIKRIRADFPEWTLTHAQGVWYADRKLSRTATHTIVGYTLTETYEKLDQGTPRATVFPRAT
jgi:hypothetical protein